MRDAAVDFFKKRGDEVKVDNLHDNFNLAEGQNDFKKCMDAENFDYQIEQKNALEKKTFTKEVQEQMDLLKWSDVVILQFPFYWFNVPGILKSYLDKVLVYHFAYGGDASIGGKMLISTTTGAPSSWYTKEGMWGKTVPEFLSNIKATAKLIKAELLETFVGFGINFSPQEKKDEILENYKKHLKKVFADL